MDTVVIESLFGRTLVAKFLKRYIKKHFGININISVNSLKYKKNDEGFDLDLHIATNGKSDELLKINRILEEDSE